MALILIDYENAIAQAKKLELAAEECGQASKTLKSQSGNSERFWQGASGNAMRRKMDESVKELNTLQSELRATASAIRTIAEELRRKDKKLSGLM